MKKIRNYTLAKFLGTGLFLLALGCASPEERATGTIDTITNDPADTAGTDTVTNTGSMSGSNGTGTDTVDTKREKATRQQGNR